MSKPTDNFQDVKLSLIQPFYSRRPLDVLKIEAIAQSVKEDGLKYPVTIYPLKGMYEGRYGLSAGAHRYAAFELLGLENIPSYVVKRVQAKIWANAENLLRSELTALDYSKEVVKYAELHDQERTLTAMKINAQPHDLGRTWLAKSLGTSRKRVAEAFLHATLNDNVVELVRGAGLDDNRAILTKLSRLESAGLQIEYLRARSKDPRPQAKLNSKSMPKSDAEQLAKLVAHWNALDIKSDFNESSPAAKRAFLKFLEAFEAH